MMNELVATAELHDVDVADDGAEGGGTFDDDGAEGGGTTFDDDDDPPSSSDDVSSEDDSDDHREGVAAFVDAPCTEAVVLRHGVFNSAFQRLRTAADGNCFYHSVASALNFDRYRTASARRKTVLAASLRRKVITRAHWTAFVAERKWDDEFMATLDEYGERVFPTFEEAVVPSYHANEFLWRLTASVLEVSIVVLKSPEEIYVTPDEGDLYEPVILIAWINDCHFEPIVQVGSDAAPQDSLSLRLWKSFQRLDYDDAAAHTLAKLATSPCARSMCGVLGKDSYVVKTILRMRKRGTAAYSGVLMADGDTCSLESDDGLASESEGDVVSVGGESLQ